MTVVRPVDPSPSLVLPPREGGLGALLALVDGVEAAFPLTEVRVRTSIVGDVARTVVEQRFHNPHSQPLEAVHIFPLPEDGAVVEMELRAGEMVVRAECKERQAAEAEFAAARQAGHRAALLTAERADVHTLRVTRIPPGEEVRGPHGGGGAPGTGRRPLPVALPDRDRPAVPARQPHRPPGTGRASGHRSGAGRRSSAAAARLAGGTRLDLEVEIQGPVRHLRCAQHAFAIDLASEGVRLAPSASSTLDRDFVLAFSTSEPDRVVSRAWTDGSHTLVVVEPPSVNLPTALPRDAVFVVDISGSMAGVKMDAAKRALTAAVHGLVAGDRFRLIAFDDRVEAMSPDFLAYDQTTLAKADRWIEQLSDRGGTEMLPAIQEALRIGDTPGRSRSVLFITDGQAWNEAELTAAVANRRLGARFFTFGIDTAVNGALLKQLARVGGGTCELTTPSDDIEEALANLEARFGSPILEEVAVEGLIGARFTGEALFTGRPATLLVEGSPTSLTVVGRGASGPVRFEVRPSRVDFPLGALWGSGSHRRPRGSAGAEAVRRGSSPAGDRARGPGVVDRLALHVVRGGGPRSGGVG
jgi:Ca-activated chloride channel family protein